MRLEPDGRYYSTQSPGAILDYEIDWTDYLDVGETIVTSSWAPIDPATGVTLTGHALVGAKAQVFVQVDTVRQNYLIANTITTSAGRTEKRSITIRCRWQ